MLTEDAPMADDDRWRNDQDRRRSRDSRREAGSYPASPQRGGFSGQGRRDDDRGDGSIARRGFGNDQSGFERGGSYTVGRGGDQGHRERDFGDSAGYGSGGSARDRRDVMGEDYGRDANDPGFGRGSRDYDDRGVFERMGDEIRSVFGDDGGHRGRGPRGYQRSDQRILEDVNDRLTEDPDVDASDIEVRVENREVTLSGTVNSRFEKRHAEDVAESVSGVAHVQNNLRVQASSMGGSSAQSRSGGGGSSGR
jgi:osmotically-inducible protein OsmY